GRNTFENGLREAAARFEFGAVGFEIGGHAIEAVDEHGELVDACSGHAIRKIAAADLADALYQFADGGADLARKILREPCGHKKNEKGNEREHRQKVRAHAAFFTAEHVVLVDV